MAIDQPNQTKFSPTKSISRVKTQVFDNRNKLSQQKTVIKPQILVNRKSNNKQSSTSKAHAPVHTVQQRAKPQKAK